MANEVALRSDPEAKVMAIRKALDQNMMVWFADKYLYVVPPSEARRWMDG